MTTTVKCENCGKLVDREDSLQDPVYDDVFFCEKCYNELADELNDEEE